MRYSVVVPVYKSEAYIERCIHSLYQQTVQDFEVIVINDCTPDKSIDLMREVVATYQGGPQLTIIDNEVNMGPSASRNRGIQASRGEYIAFLDSDDYVPNDFIESLAHAIEETQADIVMFDYIELRKNGDSIKRVNPPADPKDVVAALFSNYMHNSLCNKLFRRELFVNNHIALPGNLKFFEDKAVCFKLFYFAKVIHYLNVPLYYYDRRNEGSLTSHHSAGFIGPSMQVVEIIDDFFHSHESTKRIDEAILENKLHVAGLVCLYGDKEERKSLLPRLGRFPLKLFIHGSGIPIYYRLSVLFKQYKMGFVSLMIRKFLEGYKGLN